MNFHGWTASLYRARAFFSAAALAFLASAWTPAFAAAPERPARPRANLRGSAPERLEAAEAALRRRPGAPRGAELEAAAASEANVQVRYRLLQGLAAAEGDNAVPALARALRADPAPLVRVAAAQELGRLSAPAAASALVRALGADADFDVRRAAAASLSLHRSSEAVAALAAAAEHSDAGLRAHAALALVRQPAGVARDRALARLERDPDARVAAAARRRAARRAER